MTDENEHPALKEFSRPVEQMKHVVGKLLKGVVVGGLIGAASLAVLAAVPGGIGAGILQVFGGNIGGWVAGKTAQIALTGAMLGGGIGGLIGAAKGFSGAEDAADEIAGEKIDAYDQTKLRQRTVADLELRRAQQYAALQEQERMLGGNEKLPNNRGLGQGFGMNG